ncbi:ABC transporter ATP-binding protein [Nodularia spumigena CS-584]|jgi:ATP-binding cassette, subfamily B, bacterial MsbA|uniref:ABC transporter ATP-binding protein n=1 Tax=Nodularia spumigena TaxID=70799 RepID=UPI0000EA87F1|nr:ABC transporter ATP-binding protein [Nodularia spumigena]AHJ31436.1 Phospholipid-lipopolysaccharide ABC transporter [Nodularia spumigena CCY9414]EAW45786.1 ABC transporter, transmembrane region [Nodularia spumigena CCY9414]MDB9381844.1 ABC transporter ATP-binding protein [Nodularia spumigena CS-584]
MSTRKLLLRFAKPYPGWILLTILLGFSGALFNGVSTALIVPVILKIVGQEVDFTNAPPILKIIINPFDNVPENYRIGVMAGAILLIIILKNIATYASVLTSSSFTRMLTSDIRESGLKLLMEVDIDYYAKMKIGDLINSLGGEIGRTANAVSNIIKLIILVITISVFVIILLSISWELTIAAAFLLSFVTLINQYAIYRSKSFGKQLSEMSKAYSIAVLETLNGIRLVKATGNEAKEYFRIKKLIRDREAADFQSQVNSQAIAPISEVMGIASLLVIIFLSRTFFSDQISTLSAVLLTYLLVLLRLLPLISQLNSLRSSFANSSTSVAIITDFLNRNNKPFMTQGNIPYTTLQEGIHFQSLSFAYPGHQKLVLKDVDLFLPCGATLALVGGSGAGKSTLADLLPRFYDPVSGSITIDGKDLRDFDLISMRKKMGIVSQDTFLFNDTVQNNIAYGRPSATVDEIITAAKRANAYEFISKLPQEFETLIGDRGVMLSGGQRQRLAIARALLQNPEILILDEATSALDTVSERLVQAALDDLSRTRTTLVIAHRLSTVQKADQIAVLEQGRVVEVGTHHELLQRGGYYSRLYSMQFSDRPKISTKSSQSFIRISDELRTRFNSMIGFLNLLIDGMVANPQEQQELITKSYKSTLKTITTVDILEDIIHLQIQEQLLSSPHQNIITKYPTFEQIAEKVRQHLNTIISILSFLDNSLKPIQPGKSKLIIESYHAAKSLIEDLEKFGNQIFKL